MATPSSLSTRTLLALDLALFGVTVLAYVPALQAGFVNLDDYDYIRANPHVLEGWSARTWPGPGPPSTAATGTR